MTAVAQISPARNEANRRLAGTSVLEHIGNTPLLRLERVANEFPNVEFCAKAEWFNPGGSVKDRPALSMIQAGLASGALRPGKTIIDATSGNTGIAYAMIGAALGYPVKLVLAGQRLARAQTHSGRFGRGTGHHSGRRRHGRRDSARFRRSLRPIRRSIFIRISTAIRPTGRRTTAPPQTKSGSRPAGDITHFVAALGTSGTFVGHDAPVEGIESGDSVHQPAAGRGVSRPGRLEAHGDRAAPRDLRRHARGRESRESGPKKPIAW